MTSPSTTRWLSLFSISECGSEGASAKPMGRFQFRLWSMIELTFVVTMLCALARIEAAYAVGFLTLVIAAATIRTFVASEHQRRLRVIGNLVGGLLFLASLWLPVKHQGDFLGWQAAMFYVQLSFNLDYHAVLSVDPWSPVILWLTNIGNLIALVVPTLVIWRPWRLSRFVTILIGTAAVLAWGQYMLGLGIETGGTGYWTWYSSLAIMLWSRLVPYSWTFERAEV